MRPPTVFAQAPTGDITHLHHQLKGRWRVALRAVMVLLSLHGLPPAQIAALLDYHPATVRRWITRYNHQGLPGLADRPRTGRPPPGRPAPDQTPHHPAPASRAMDTSAPVALPGPPPAEPAHPVPPTAPGGRVAPAALKPSLAATPHTMPSWPRSPPGCTCCWPVRSSGPRTRPTCTCCPPSRASWTLRDRRPHILTPGRNRQITVLGALEVTTGRWTYRLGKRSAADFVALLEQVVATFPTAPAIVVICDNDSIHHARLVRRFVADHPGLHLWFGARYSPHDNPVDRIWGGLKASVANTAVSWPGRRRQVHAFFRARSPDQLLVTAAPWTSPWFPADYAQNFRKGA